MGRMALHRLVIVGGGFGGLVAARALRRATLDITLIDRRNFHLFQPLLYQVATGGLSPANIAAPLRAILKRQTNARVLLAEARGFDPVNRRVHLADGHLDYDSLVVATGARSNYFGHDTWEHAAPGLKSLEDATEIRRRVFSAFEQAERETDRARARARLTFVVIGAGPTGVELAGALAEISRDTLRNDFRRINPADASILLVDMSERILPSFPPELSEKAAAALRALGVIIRCKTAVQNITPEHVLLKADDHTEQVFAHTTLWAAGVAASPLGKALADATGAHVDRAGRVIVEPNLTLKGHPEIFVIGDLAHCVTGDGKPLPGVATVAMQQGHYVARVLEARINGDAEAKPFVYKDPGSMATIGRKAGIVHIGKWCYSGYFAWLTWLFVHLIKLMEFHNRVLVLFQWAWSYFTFNRSARLITGEAQSGDHAPKELPHH